MRKLKWLSVELQRLSTGFVLTVETTTTRYDQARPDLKRAFSTFTAARDWLTRRGCLIVPKGMGDSNNWSWMKIKKITRIGDKINARRMVIGHKRFRELERRQEETHRGLLAGIDDIEGAFSTCAAVKIWLEQNAC